MLERLHPEKYEIVLAEESAKLPGPARCAAHENFAENSPICEPCRLYRNWSARIQRRFALRGFSFRPAVVHDTEPPQCPDGHKSARKHHGECDICHRIVNWHKREATLVAQTTGRSLIFRDIPRLATHVRALESAGMPVVEIAERIGSSDRVVRHLVTRPPKFVRVEYAEAILAIPIPEIRRTLVPNALGWHRRRVDATGTRRRVQSGVVNGHSITEQAAMLGWSKYTMRRWMHDGVRGPASVSIDAADAMAALYPRLMANPGTNRAAITSARSRGWLPGRYYSEANIDDPSYDPLAIVVSPTGLHRRFRALAWLGHGPEEVAPRIGEDVDKVRRWMLGGSAPAYVLHLVIPVYERLSFTQGPNEQVADLARHEDWAPPLAWDDIDMDSPNARPYVDLPTNFHGKSKFVLTSAIFDALDGKIEAKHLVHAEKVKVVWILHRGRGWSDRRIAAWLKWNEDLDRGQRAVTKFREREGIRGFGVTNGRDGYAQADEGLILWGAAA